MKNVHFGPFNALRLHLVEIPLMAISKKWGKQNIPYFFST